MINIVWSLYKGFPNTDVVNNVDTTVFHIVLTIYVYDTRSKTNKTNDAITKLGDHEQNMHETTKRKERSPR